MNVEQSLAREWMRLIQAQMEAEILMPNEWTNVDRVFAHTFEMGDNLGLYFDSRKDPPMAKPADKKHKDHVANQIVHCQAAIDKLKTIIADPNTTAEELAEATSDLAEQTAKMARLTGTGVAPDTTEPTP